MVTFSGGVEFPDELLAVTITSQLILFPVAFHTIELDVLWVGKLPQEDVHAYDVAPVQVTVTVDVPPFATCGGAAIIAVQTGTPPPPLFPPPPQVPFEQLLVPSAHTALVQELLVGAVQLELRFPLASLIIVSAQLYVPAPPQLFP